MFNIFSIFPKIYLGNIYAPSLEENTIWSFSKLPVVQANIKMETKES